MRQAIFARGLLGLLLTVSFGVGAKGAEGTGQAGASDWPMWRHDAGRTAASPADLPPVLHLQWTRQYSPRVPVWDDPLNRDLMPYDRVFEPIVMGGRMFVGFNDRDKVVALDVRTGRELWAFYTNGPIRFPPAAWQGKVYAASDDGYLYCLGAKDGKLKWKFRGGPSERKVLGNRRVISSWSARGGPVVRDGKVYFAASIWPFMGIFIHALDAESGKPLWVNDGGGARYIKQPHRAPSFAGVAPQGALVATKNVLLVPGGRSVPAALDRKTGKLLYFNLVQGGKGNGGSFVIANETEFFVHTRRRGVRAYALSNGARSKFTANEPVLAADGGLYTSSSSRIQRLDARKRVRWEVAADGSGDLIQAGRRLYAAGRDSITALELPAGGGKPGIAWTQKIKGRVRRLLAAGGQLFAVTLDGRILAFGGEQKEAKTLSETPRAIQPDAALSKQAQAILERSGAREGYALCFGVDEGRLLEALLARSKLHVVAVDPDAEKIERLRRRFDAAGLYGKRVALHPGDPLSFRAPPYIAHLIVVGRAQASRYAQGPFIEALYRSVRPYGGALWLPLSKAQRAPLEGLVAGGKLPKAKLLPDAGGVLLVRQGALPGAADWTHQYGDIANTVKSNDRRVKLPLGLLWFGGNSNLDVLPRHGHGPPEQVVGGRLFIEGMAGLSARDVYTGRVLWRVSFKDFGTAGVYFDRSYKSIPLSTDYNQRHIPGANGRGTNFVATQDAVYVALGSSCHVLDAQTGRTRKVIALPRKEGAVQAPKWAFIGVYQDVLLAGSGFADFEHKQGQPSKKYDTWRRSVGLSASAGLVAFDRKTGEVRWRIKARHGFLNNGIVAGNGRVYCLDKLPKSVEKKMGAQGKAAAATYRIVALDSQSGRTLWEARKDIFGTWLSYSEKYDILLQAGARGSDRLRDEVSRGMIAYRGQDGSVRWKKMRQGYTGPCILYHDTIITTTNSYGISNGAFSLLDGSPKLIANPITGRKEAWRFSRAYGCNTVIGSEHLLTFRSGAAGYYDLDSKSGTGNFGGFKSGCTSNLVVGDGVLNAPDYTRTCSCAYQNQTSLALVPMPEAEMWTNSALGRGAEAGGAVRRVGINFGAPGDRRADNGTLWLDYPSVGGSSPQLSVTLQGGAPQYFRHHASRVPGPGLPWVCASGVRNAASISVNLAVGGPAAQGAGVRVASGNDDAEESAKDGGMYMDSSDLELIEDRAPQVVGIRFAHVPLKPGQAIARAALQFTVDERSTAPARLTLRAEASDNAPPIRNHHFNISSRPKTKAAVTWTPKPWSREGEAGADQRTPDLAPLLREIAARPGWKSGHAMLFIITGKGKRVAESYDGSKAGAPRLLMEAKQKAGAEKPAQAGVPYTVRLYFAEPDGLGSGERVFDVALQGRTVLKDFDIAKQAGGSNRGVVKEFKSIPVAGALRLTLKPGAGAKAPPVLCGLELITEKK